MFEYDNHPRTNRKSLKGPPKVKDAIENFHGNGFISKINK